MIRSHFSKTFLVLWVATSAFALSAHAHGKMDRKIASVIQRNAEDDCAKASMSAFVENIGANLLDMVSNPAQREKIAAWREQERVDLFGPESPCGKSSESAAAAVN